MAKSIYFLLLTTLALVPGGLGVPATPKPGTTPNTKSFLTTFAVPSLPLTAATPVPVGLNDLAWPGLFVNKATALAITPSQSPPERAVAELRTAISTGRLPGISVKYTNSKTKSFTLLYIYFACEANTSNELSSLPIACTVLVKARKAGTGEQIGPRRITYNPETFLGTGNVLGLRGKMVQVSFTELVDVEFVEFEIESASIPVASRETAVFLMDDVSHNNKYY